MVHDVAAKHPEHSIVIIENGHVTGRKGGDGASHVAMEQVRNAENNRIFNLYLTDSGQRVYQDHTSFNHSCQASTFRMLETFSTQELEHHLMVQRKLNEAYQSDVQNSKEHHQ